MTNKFDKNVKKRYLIQMGQIHPNIEIVSDYLGQAKNITLHCKRCGHTFEQQARVALRSNNIWGCPYCNRKENDKRHTINPKTMIDRVTNHFPYIVYILGYTGSKSKPLFYCNVCHSYFRARIYNIMKSKYGCSNCSKKHMNDDKRLTDISFKNRLNDKYSNLQLLSKYKSDTYPLKFICKLCHHKFEIKPCILYERSYGCPYCRDLSKRPKNSKYFNQKEFIIELQQRLPSLLLITPFKGYHKPIKLRCKYCLHTWVTTPRNAFHRNIDLCPECMKWKQQSRTLNCVKWYQHNIRNKFPNESYRHYCCTAFNAYVHHKNKSMKILSLFNGTMYPIKIQCKKCGYKRIILADTLLKAPVCTNCNKKLWSSGERIIATILDKHHILFEHSFKPHTLIDQHYLHFDFKIKDILIEYQGQQHYQPVEYFGGEQYFKKQIKHDQMKRDWAKKNGYKLVEIRYDQNIKEVMLPLISSLEHNVSVEDNVN